MRACRVAAPLRLLLTVFLLAATLGASQGGGSQPRRVSLVVTGAHVVTMNPGREVLSPGAVAIDGRDIVAVGTEADITSRFVAADMVDGRDQVLLPGLINTHTHAPMVMYRGLADDLALMDWLQKYIFPGEAKTVSPRMVRIGTRLAALEMIQSGTTTFADMYYFEEEVGRAAREAGLRGVLGQTIIGFPVADAKTPAEGLARTEKFIKEFAGDDLITPVPAPHAMYTLDEASLKTAREMADRYKLPMLIHLAETEEEVKISKEKHRLTPAGYLESIGFLSPSVVAAHCVWIGDEDRALLARRGVKVSHNPESNMKLASGTAPVPAFLASGMTVGLGTDGAASNNDLDMFEAMRQAALLHKLVTRDPQTLPASAVLQMATIGGARVLGLDAKVGSIEAGKRADLILVSMRGARQTPLYNPVSHLVYVSRGDDVQTTIVNGRVLMRDRKVLTLDERAVLADARELAGAVRKAVERTPN